MYRLLGMVARFGEWGSRQRSHGIPPHLVLMALCLFGFLLGLGNYLEYSANRGLPDAISQVQLLEGTFPHKDYVEISGNFLQQARLSGEDKMVYLPLLEGASKTVTYVRASDQMAVPPEGETVKVRGMLHFVGRSLEAQLPQDQQGIRFNRNQYVSYGTAPASPVTAVVLMVLSVPVGLLLLLTFLLKYIVFRAHGLPDQGAPASAPQQIGITGLFSAENNQSQRFLDIAGRLCKGRLEASVTTSKPPSTRQFSIDLDLDSLKKIQAGTLYLGFQQRPALRFSCLDKNRGKRQQIVLSFANESQRRFVWQELTAICAVKP